MRTIKVWLATITVLLCSLTASAHDFEVDGIYYDITSSTGLTVAVTYRGNSSGSYSNEYSGAVTIPETVTYNNNTYSVTSIGNSAFRGCSSLTSITLPEGVTSIEYSAFYGCSSVTSIILPEGVTSIGNNTFYGCSSLTSITIPESVTSIGSSAFFGCSSLTSITLPEGVTSIGDNAFHNCSNLTSITIPKSVATIGNSSFAGCSSLTSITISENSQLTSIGDHTFYNCRNLTSITIPASVTSIGSWAFYNCSNLATITINCANVGDWFRGNTSIKEVVLGEDVTSIGQSAFYGCNNLKDVINFSGLNIQKGSSDNGDVGYYADRVINIDNIIDGYCFKTIDGIHYLTGYIGDDTELVLPEDYQGENYQIGDNVFYNCSGLTSISFSKSVTSIGDNAFYNCSNLTSITIPKSVATIGNSSFSGCSSLTAVTIPSSVTSIGDNAFYGCRSLTSITIPEGVTSIGDHTFYNCRNLTSITIPESVTSIGEYAFCDCSSLTSITLPEGVTSIEDAAFRGCSSLTTITLPEGVTSIGEYAFYGCSSLTSINIPEGVTSIGDHTFYCCRSLTSITIPEGVTSIGSDAFRGCSSLTSIILPEGVTSIGRYAFEACSSLTSIILPEGVTSIGYDAFSGCSNLKTVINFSGLNIQKGSWDNGYVGYYANRIFNPDSVIDDYGFKTIDDVHYLIVYIGNDTELTLPEDYQGDSYQIGEYAFYGCSNLTSITIPKSVTGIGNRAFFGCTGKLIVNCNIPSASSISDGVFYNSAFTKVIFGEEVTSIGDYAFYGCSSLTSITIPENSQLTSIGNRAFYGCSSLTSITLPASVTSIGSWAFWNCTNLHSVTIGNGVLSIGSAAFNSPQKVIWMTNTPPTGYGNANGSINYVANDQYVSLSNVKVYPYLSSMFEVEGVKYVPVSPSERTCHAVDCVYDDSTAVVNVDETVLFNGIAMTVTEVMPYTFYGNDYIKEVSISHLGNIGDYAFENCDGIKTLTTSNNGDIGDYAFKNCDSIQIVNISNQGHIGNQAFYQCSNLQEIVVPNSVEAIGEYCFSECSAMKSATIGDGVGNITPHTFGNCTALEHVVIGDGVTTISCYAFSGCSVLANVELGNRVATIGDYAFQNCSSLHEISISQAITSIGDYVFSGCTQLSDVIIEDRTTALSLGSNGSSAFFADCPLDSVYVGGKITYSTANDEGYSPFYRNTSLRTVVITDREEQIYDNEFYGCTNLQNVIIGNGVISIGNYAFSGCSSLEEFSFGSNMETIGAEAFSDCTNLTTITSYSATPPVCGTQALDDINKWTCRLCVPSGYATAYQVADQWKEFFFIEDVVEVKKYTLTFMVDGGVYQTLSLTHNAEVTIPNTPTKEGYTFSGWGEVPATMPAEDVTISGFFTPNIYRVHYYVDEKLVHTAEVAYGEAIPEYAYEPTIKGEVFVGWIGEAYETMPAHDVSYKAEIEVISVNLTIDQYGSGTFCSMPALDFSDVAGLKAYVATGYNTATGVVTLTRVMTAKPGEGLFLKGKSGDYEVPTMENSESFMQNLLVGTLRNAIVNATSNDGLSVNYEYTAKGEDTAPLFYRITDNITLETGKAYLQLPKAWLGTGATRAAIGLRFDDEEMEFGDEEQSADVAAPAVIYDLQGRRVANPTKGVFIVNGKKVVFK